MHVRFAPRQSDLYSGIFIRHARMNNWSIRNRILLMALLPGVMVSLVLGMFFIVGRATDLSDFNRMCQTCAEHISDMIYKYLSLVFKPAKCR